MENRPQIELEWLIHYKCNFRCPYCFFEGMWEEVEARNVYRPLEEWRAVWERVRARHGLVRLLITGGEPFIYPGFVDLVAALAPGFSIGFDTNLGCARDLISEFVQKVPRSEYLSIACSFHPRFAQFDVFLEKAVLLQEAGFRVNVQYVSYPEQLPMLLDFKSRFEKAGFYFIPLPFRGVYQGRHYPQAHTDAEKRIVYQSSEGLIPEHREKVGKLLDQVESKARLCRAGQAYARIDNDGTVYRCGASVSNASTRPMGNIFDENFRFLAQPEPCAQEKCPCESRWLV